MASSQDSKQINIKELLSKYKDKVNGKTREDGLGHELDINELEQLLALVLHKNISYIYKNFDKKLNRSNILSFEKLIKKRQAGWSLAYLKKHKEFFNLNFIVSRHTLIPRPDSELLIEEALKNTKDHQNIIDIGTGSGTLILSLAKNNKHQANYTAVDISSPALQLAQTNARKLGLKNKIKFIKSDLLNNIINKKFDIIIANLPYLTPTQMKEPSIKKEPTTALLSGQDGLDHYRKLLKQIPKHLNKKYLMLLEIDPNQAEKIKREISNHLPQAKIKFLKDLATNIRVVKIST